MTWTNCDENVNFPHGPPDRQVKTLPGDDPVWPSPDITAAESLLSWRPNVPLEQGLSKTIQYVKDVLSRHFLRKPTT
jgi:nucleoside-diphosphate-sugar epimerase